MCGDKKFGPNLASVDPVRRLCNSGGRKKVASVTGVISSFFKWETVILQVRMQLFNF